MAEETRFWKCPKCGKRNRYKVKLVMGFGNVIGDPSCKCGLARFTPAYYELIKQKTNSTKEVV